MNTHRSPTPRPLDAYRLNGLAILCLSLALGACSGGGGGGSAAAGTPVVAAADTDHDGVPDTADAMPNDATRFVDNVTVPLAGLNASGGGFTTATAVNNGGSVVGYAENAASEIRAVRWLVSASDGSASAPTPLPAVDGGGTYSAAYAVNDAGLAVGESEAGTGVFVATAWDIDGTATALAASVSFPVAGRSAAHGANNRATPQIVGEASTVDGALRAVVWNGVAGAPVDLGILPGGTFSSALAISNDGLVVGEADTATGVTHAAAWRVDANGAKTVGPVDLGIITVADVRSIALAVDSAGRVVGESEDRAGVVHAGLWTLDPTTLAPSAKSDLGADGSAAAINASNRIAGYLGSAAQASVWDTRNTGLPNSAVAETAASEAFGLNDGNLLVGMMATATGASAFVAVPK
jgi:probable HAF family extracellular repeat protein